MTAHELYDRALREGVVVEHPDRRLFRLSGPQRVWFLQNTVTADVEGAETGRWVESCFLEPKGHVLAHFRIGLADEEIWLDADPPATQLVEWFSRYRFRTRVEIEDASRGAFTVLGPAASGLAAPGEVRVSAQAVVFGDRLGEVALAEVHAAEAPAAVAALCPAPDSLYEVLRIEAGVGRFGADYGPATLPQEAGLSRLVSVDKGCYVGQEVVARIRFRGHVNRVLRPVTLEGTPRRSGAEPRTDLVGQALLLEGSRVGQLTSAAVSPRLGAVGIAMVRVEPEEGARLEVEGGGVAVLGPIPEGTKVKIS